MGGLRAAAVIPAFNEEATVGDVVRTVVGSGQFEDVIVVSDGSTDRTVDEARKAGATQVHDFPVNKGKGAAMGHGVAHTDAPVVCFFDADLRGLTAEHVKSVLEPVIYGYRYMNVGLRDRGRFWTGLMKILPLVGGERAVRRDIIDLIPEKYMHGFKAESALNYFCRLNDHPYGYVVLPGLSIRRKYEKVGWVRALAQYVKMWAQVAWAMFQVRLARGEFRSHGLHMSHVHGGKRRSWEE